MLGSGTSEQLSNVRTMSVEDLEQLISLSRFFTSRQLTISVYNPQGFVTISSPLAAILVEVRQH